jgi:chromosome segregation ATPase
VEKNFQRLESLEKHVQNLSKDVDSLPRRLEDITEQIQTLSENKDRAAHALSQLESLESLLSDVEERIESMQKAREWLGRTETRLEQIAKQADDQLKLLGNLLKKSSKDTAGDDGAPSNRVRNMVRQLAHQGWGVKEIAKQTELSVGEVELILELLPK